MIELQSTYHFSIPDRILNVTMFDIFTIILLLLNIYVQAATIQTETPSSPTLNHTEINATNTTRPLLTFFDSIDRIIEKKCLENANETKLQEVAEKLHEFKAYWLEALRSFPPNVSTDQFKDVCTERSKDFRKYLNKFVQELLFCLKPQERFLERFVLDGYGNYNRHFCELSANLTASALINSKKCMRKLKEHPEMSPAIVCYENSKVFGFNSTLDVYTKGEFCDDLADIQVCYERMFDLHCSYAPELKDKRKELAKPRMEFCLTK